MARFLALGTAALIVLSAFAFWPAYLSRPFGSVDPYTHFHAAVGAAWLGLLFAQALLARGHRVAHRWLGRSSIVLAPAFVLSSVLLAHQRFSRMDETTFAREATTLYLPVSAALLFAGAYAGAMAWRRRAVGVHARFMACTALLLVDPVLGRCLAFYLPPLPAMWCYQVVTFGLEVVLLATMLRTLPEQSPGRAAFRRFAAVYALVLAAWFALPYAAPWFAFASWFRRLPLT